MMAPLIRQLERPHCSHNRSFVVHTEIAQRLLTQADLCDLPRSAQLTCARCGRASLISVWSEGTPYAIQGLVPRRRRKRLLATKLRTIRAGHRGRSRPLRNAWHRADHAR
jgi:hypothetical protein